MSPYIGRTMGVFHYWVVRRLMGRHMKSRLYGMWYFPPLAEVMEDVGIQEVETYVASRQNIVAKFIATRPIVNLFMAAVWSLGGRVLKRLWVHKGLEL